MNAVVQCLSNTDLLAEFLALGRAGGAGRAEVTEQLAALVRALDARIHAPTFRRVQGRQRPAASSPRRSAAAALRPFAFPLLDKWVLHQEGGLGTSRDDSYQFSLGLSLLF